MIKIVSFASAALLTGALLAASTIHFNISTGWIGASVLLGWALWARRRWSRAEVLELAEPSAPEQVIWLRTFGVGMLLGRLVLVLLNPQIDFHVGNGNSLAVDSWTLTGALLIAVMLFRYHPRERDERYEFVAARGIRAGYSCLIICLIGLLGFLGFAPPNFREPLTHWMLANLLVALLLFAYFVQLIAQLIHYRPRHD